MESRLINNWIPTAGKDFWLMARFYGPDKVPFQKDVGDARRREDELSDMTKAKMATETPAAITMPDRVETSLGTLRFTDGFLDDATVEKVFDNLDFQHAVQAFLTTMPAASHVASRRGVRGFGPDNQTVLIFESLMDSRSPVSHRQHGEHLCRSPG